MIAAIHAGWKSAYKGIIKKVVNFMLNKGCKEKNIVASIGPCIHLKSYNVKNDFQKKFIKKNKINDITKKLGLATKHVLEYRRDNKTNCKETYNPNRWRRYEPFHHLHCHCWDPRTQSATAKVPPNWGWTEAALTWRDGEASDAMELPWTT